MQGGMCPNLHDPFIIGLPYDHPHPSGSQKFAYKNFGCWAMALWQWALNVLVTSTSTIYYAHPYIQDYSGTPLKRTPLGAKMLSFIDRCP